MNAIDRAKAVLRSGGTVVINEPCNCGDNIRHNNGGNYHQVIRVKIRLGRVWANFDTTSELTHSTNWLLADESIIDGHAGWL